MTRTPAIVFRADASHDVGFGHVMRLCAVIEEVAPVGAEPIALFGGDHTLAAWIRNHDLSAHVRPPTRPWTCADLLAVADQPGVRAVVIDGPTLAAELVPALAGRGVRTIVIDDRGDCPLSIDAVVNPNFNAPALAAGYPGAQLRLLGRDYLMLRRAIRRYPRGSCHPRAATSLRIVVTFGGSDPVGATVRTLQLIPPGRPSEIFVLAGPGFRDDEALRTAATAATAAGHTVEIIRDPEDPAELFVSADAAICSAGGTLGELAYLGCPALGFAIAPDQVASARAQVDAGLIAGGHAWASLDDDTLRSQLQAFFDDDGSRRDHRQRALATADEFGSRRIVAEAIS